MTEEEMITIKGRTLKKLGMENLKGTVFQEAMSVVSIGAGEEITALESKRRAVYIYSGSVQATVYSREGRTFYRYFQPGETFMVAESILGDEGNELTINYGMDLHIMKEAVIVFLPFKEIFKYEVSNRMDILERIMGMASVEKADLVSYFLGKVIYSDEEFLLMALEKEGVFYEGTPLLAKSLNMNIRSLQRCLKKLEELGIISREGSTIKIRDMKKFQEYRKSIEK